VPIVNGLAKEFDGKMQFKVLSKAAAGSVERIEKYGLEVHGMVITDQDDTVVWSESGHMQKRATVKAAIEQCLKG
jgi:hypothetical protein